MKFFFSKRIIITFFIFQFASIRPMITALRRSSYSAATNSPLYRTRIHPTRRATIPQWRQWSHTQLPALIRLVPEAWNQHSPAQAIAFLNSPILKNMLSTTSNDPKMQFAHQLFHQITSDEPVQVSHQGVSRYLSPELLGACVGALEKNVQDNDSIVAQLTQLGQSEYQKITETNNKFSAKQRDELKNFIALMNAVNTSDPEFVRSALGAYLDLKANPANYHDMIHYLLGRSTFQPISIEEITALRSALKTDNITTASVYSEADYTRFKENIAKCASAQDKIKYAHDNFALAIGAIIEEKRALSQYCPRVILGKYGFKDQKALSACAETAFRDLFNNMLFDKKTDSFDLSQLPSSVHVRDDFKQFYSTYSTPNTINTRAAGQSFMDIVSGIDGVQYVQTDDKNRIHHYEIRSIDNTANFIALCNHFFGIKVTDLTELANALSDKKRITVFTSEFDSQKNQTTINITITDNVTHTNKELKLCFFPGHSWFTTEREQFETSFLDATLLSRDESPLSRALFNVHPQPALDRLLLHAAQHGRAPKKIDPLLFYTLPARTDHEKSRIIIDTLLYSHDQGPLDFAYSLYQSMSDEGKIDVISYALGSDTFLNKLSHDARTNQQFNELIRRNIRIILEGVYGNRESMAKMQQRLTTAQEIKEYENALNSIKKEINNEL